MTEVLELFRSLPRYVSARAVGDRVPGLIAGPLAPLRLVNRDDPKPPAEGWGSLKPRLSGICGSDLALLSGRSSFYFSPLVSMPFVPGHEVIAVTAEEIRDVGAGERVVIDPVLSCEARGLEPCPQCSEGRTGRCDRVTVGHVSPGLQTGYCADTGGGWGGRMVAHRSQLHPVPDDLSDAKAVLIEPLSCAVHSVLRGRVQTGDAVLVAGAGTVGLLTILALKQLASPGRVTAVAKHSRQRELAQEFGADEVVSSDEAVAALRRSTRAIRLEPERGLAYLMGGVDVAFDAVGSKATLDLALRTTRAGGRVVLSGIPSGGSDLAPVWFRELEIAGAYTSGIETVNGERRPAFDIALDMAAGSPVERLLGATYRLSRWREAIDHALSSGRLGTPKVAFEIGGSN